MNNNGNELMATVSRMPLVHIERDSFLEKQLIKDYPKEIVKKAVAYTPAAAGIGRPAIEHLAKSCISAERAAAVATSTAAGLPGGLAMAATIPMDLAQYTAHLFRVAQKLSYLYGWPDLNAPNKGLGEDDETNAMLTWMLIGAAIGVQGAGKAVTTVAEKIAAKYASQAAKKTVPLFFEKVVGFGLAKEIAKKVGIKLSKQAFAKGMSKAVPIIGGVTSGGLTLVTFNIETDRLKNQLAKTKLSDPEYFREFYKNSSNDDLQELLD